MATLFEIGPNHSGYNLHRYEEVMLIAAFLDIRHRLPDRDTEDFRQWFFESGRGVSERIIGKFNGHLKALKKRPLAFVVEPRYEPREPYDVLRHAERGRAREDLLDEIQGPQGTILIAEANQVWQNDADIYGVPQAPSSFAPSTWRQDVDAPKPVSKPNEERPASYGSDVITNAMMQSLRNLDDRSSGSAESLTRIEQSLQTIVGLLERQTAALEQQNDLLREAAGQRSKREGDQVEERKESRLPRALSFLR